MILPTKRLPVEKSLLSVGEDILAILEKPRSVSRLWTLLKRRRKDRLKAQVTFDWFVLALDMLYAIEAIDLNDGSIVRRSK